MKAIERLRKEALKSCNFKGHTMTRFSRQYRHWWDAKCKICGMSTTIRDDTQPNEADISGEAIALHCTG